MNEEEEELYGFLLSIGIGSGEPIRSPDKLYKKVCNWLDELWFDSEKLYCWGCGKSSRMEHHHLITRQEMTKIGKPWLVIDPQNIIPLCNDCHHNKYHDGSLEDKLKLDCWSVILDYFKDNHHELYMHFYFKIEEHERCNKETK